MDADQRILDSALAHGSGLDGLVNNAGNMYRAALADLDESALVGVPPKRHRRHDDVVNLRAALSARGGSIVFLGSIHTRRAFPGSLCSHKVSHPGADQGACRGAGEQG